MTRKDDLKAKFQTGMIPTQQDFAEFIDMFVASINDKDPDNEGNVTTDFKVIDPLGPDRPPTDYPVGASEFYSDYNPNDYAQYIADNPSMSQLEQGQICVRTFRSNGFSYQQVDNVKDGIFNAAYIRLNTSPSAWGVLSPVVSGSITPIDVVDNLLSNSATDALSANQGKILASMIEDIEDLATGPQGPPGPQGTQGPKGDPGTNGADGAKGDKGDKGDTGSTGPKGDKGDKGEQGIQGIQGLQGIQGERGEKGERGEGFVVTMAFPSLQDAEDYLNGPNNTLVDGNFISIANENNPTENGNVYILTDGDFLFQFTAQGVKGETGPTGPQGIQGVAGPQGTQGVKGDKGDKGDTGDTGLKGDKGDKGDKGEDGTKWFYGEDDPIDGDGEEGALYLQGSNGSVFKYEDGYWLPTYISLLGPEGPRGPEGPEGDVGVPGPKGDKGDKGDPGDVGTLPKASTIQEGIVQLTNELNGTSEVLALTQKGGNTLSQGLSSLSISLDDHATHVAVSGLHGSLGHVIPDGTTITVDEDGVISAVSGTSTIDNTITALQAPSTFARGHTISVVEDSTFDTVFKNLTGAKTNLLKMHFTVDTYNMSDATASYKYYQRIAVSVGDDFNKPNLVGHISRLSTSSSSWGPSYFEPVLFFTEDTQFPIKYSIAGSKLNSIKNNKKYVSVRSEPDNSLTSFWVEEVAPPKVLSLAESPTPPEGEGFVYSAESAKEMIDTHENKKASTTVSGHVKIDGTTVKMNNNDQMYVDFSDLPIPIQMNSEYIMSASPTTYPVGHVISMIGPDDSGFSDLVTEFSLEYDVDLSATSTRFIVQTVKSDKNMTHQTAQAVTSNRGSVLGTMYRFSQSSIYGFSSWYAQTQVLTGRGAPGDQGRGEGMSGNLYVNSITGKVHAKAGYDKTVGYTNWRVVGPTVVNNTFDPVEDDDEHVYSAYTVEEMFEGAKNNLKNNVKLNRIWDSRPIVANATTWTVDFSDETELTDLNNYDFEVYDDGVLVFGNPITHTVNNVNKTVTFTPQTPMSRPFTITCIGRGMEFPQ